MSKCKECKWWGGNPNNNEAMYRGDCRFDAPRVIQLGDINTGLERVTAWPRTMPSDGCGRWEQRTPSLRRPRKGEPANGGVAKLQDYRHES